MKTQVKTRIGVFALASLMMSALAISPSISAIASTFPNVSLSVVQTLIALPSLTSLLAGFLVSKLSTYIDRSQLALSGVSLIIIGGLFPFFFHQYFAFLMVGAAILGLGVGTLATTNPAIISQNFQAHERQVVFGQYTAFVSLGGMLLIFTGGMLSGKSWQYNYLVFLYPVLVLLLAFVNLPRIKVAESARENLDFSFVFKNKKVWLLAFVGFGFMFVFDTFSVNISILVEQHKLGGIQVISIASAMLIFSGFISGLLFKYTSKLAGAYNLVLAFLLISVGMVVTAMSHSVPLVMAGGFLSGFGLSVVFARIPYLMSLLVENVYLPLAITVYTTAVASAAFLSPFVINNIRMAMGYAQVSMSYIVAAVFGVFFLLFLIVTNLEKKVLNQNGKDIQPSVKQLNSKFN